MSAHPSLPGSMKAIEISQPGEPEVLVVTERPLPTPQAGEILVKVAAAGVNRPDVLQRRGNYAPPPGASDIPGLEIAGEVVALGEGVQRYALGDKVCALIAGGGYAEYCKVHESNALPVPVGFSMVEAAAIPETFFTVWVNVFQRGHLKAGETVLIHGGTSGIGTVATMLAKAFCAHVITTVGSEDKRQASLALGADVAINYRSEDFVERTKSATDGKGADVIVDLIAGDYLAKNYQAAAMEGRIVQIGTQNGVVKELNLMPLLLKRLTHTGSTLRSRSVEDKGQIAAELLEKVWPLLERGVLKPQIFKTFRLEQAAEAHALMESSEHIGKIMLTH
ncbi:NAD(P)H-quinone oxidoreductase [Serratia ficaria]|uniref:Beta-ketoacyl-acyl-carrier-protein synthase I n=1 Tax=Serratia ficaria TaxID=61651 RepID=A0A240C641_SERFI|nr:NAD(P)H-quinone oxidoreductase [Serratia ficaria]MEE4481624.1 NAD(P)H-quinone oxidoreductase [Serratia ficaria]REF44123.1 putative PIG3 family NAD(P)H quinone oxidoreductase [Serratia ficaria]CAI0741372.1 Beta-ketoacyl-acyl-carrier-protein synthase I [Serratia ficaria]CAI0745733.1 Beta-ketoacyl-acyl-carrier-protein synthase I [Serratia ficaria]CAI0761657.1 Beta-ketoacyl-acyl-carrier-protein synthase I [Serratia ficaria]